MAALTKHEEILDAVGVVLLGLNLNGIGTRVYRREGFADESWKTTMEFPCLVYGPVGTEEEAEATSLKDGTNYPVTIRIVDRVDAARDPANIPKHLLWRRQVRNAFHHRTLTGVVGVTIVRCRPSAMSDPPGRSLDLHVMPLVFSFLTFETRA